MVSPLLNASCVLDGPCAIRHVSRLFCGSFVKDDVCTQSQMVSKMGRVSEAGRARIICNSETRHLKRCHVRTTFFCRWVNLFPSPSHTDKKCFLSFICQGHSLHKLKHKPFS